MSGSLFNRFLLSVLLFLSPGSDSFSQPKPDDNARKWADSVFSTLSEDEKIAQLIVVRLSSINLSTREVTFYEKEVEESVLKYNVGGICLFQGGPVQQASLINHYQQLARVPILMTIDAENGLGMRLDSVRPLPRQLMLGAVRDSSVIYQYGRWVGEQCKRLGIQMNYAPVVDVNNNPNNPVINDRSFGENRENVAWHGIRYMRGMQDAGILTCAKHFPGHGDVDIDSHYDLPVIRKSREQLDSLELYPFRKIIEAGVNGVMVGHLFIPAIDPKQNRAASISYNNVTGLLKKDLGFEGLTFTDALEMKGVVKYFPDGAAAVESLIAGNDMLCLPGDVSMVIQKIRKAIRKRRIKWETINDHVRKVLIAKYKSGLAKWQPVSLEGLAKDLNRKTDDIRKRVAAQAITLVKYENRAAFPLPVSQNNRVAYLGIGISEDNAFAKRMRGDYNADVFYFGYRQDPSGIPSLVNLLESRYDVVVIGLHSFARFPARNFNVSEAAMDLVRQLDSKLPVTTFVFGNPYLIKNFCDLNNIVACYEDDEITQQVAADILNGNSVAMGQLPVSVCEKLPYGTGIQTAILPYAGPRVLGMASDKLKLIDSLAEDAIRQKATPGCVVLVAKDGKIAFYKSYGYYTYDSTESVCLESIYDMASVTKICATTLAVMKLYDQGRLDINKRLKDYLPWVRGTDKADLVIREILLHQAGLKSYIPFFREAMDTTSGIPDSSVFQNQPSENYGIEVADHFYMKTAWRDTMYRKILQSHLEKPGAYVYSDNDFIFLGKVAEAITGLPLNEFVAREFYQPLGLATAGFLPRKRFSLEQIAPTEKETYFRRQLIRGYVHDPGAAMFGGVSGHAGLFSDAYDIAVIMQMLLNKGVLNGRRFLSDTTIRLFTAYHSNISRRGFGFDKPEKDNIIRIEPYPCLSTSSETFGHTGFTGTCAWADPVQNLVFVFLSNRVYPNSGSRLLQLNVRGNMQEAAYQAIHR